MRWVVMGGLLALLAGCGGTGGFGAGKHSSEASVGWYCVDNAITGIKECQKRLLRDGVPVNNKVYDRDQSQEPAPSAADNSPLTAVHAVDHGSSLQVENQGPPAREVRGYVERATVSEGNAQPAGQSSVR